MNGIKMLKIRISPIASYDNECINPIPVISEDDLIKVKFIREAHKLGSYELRSTHYIKKATHGNILKNQFPVIWSHMKTDVAAFIKSRGICNRAENFKASLEMRNSKGRCYKAYQPFSHVSVDPLGYVKIKVERKVYLSPVCKDLECFVNREMIETNQEMIIEKEECVPLAQIPLQKYLCLYIYELFGPP